jgi:hypothetical protein
MQGSKRYQVGILSTGGPLVMGLVVSMRCIEAVDLHYSAMRSVVQLEGQALKTS